jgi:hypothetical protein
MRRLPPLLALVGTLLLATPTLAQNVAPDGVRVPDDCRDADLTVVCGLIPPWGNGMFEYFGGGPDYPATRRFIPFPADERPWRLCLEGAFGPEWSLRPCSEMIAKDADALADFAGICVMREELETCALGELSEFDLPVHFVWNEEGIEVISEGSAVEFEYSYAVPDDCADPYTICGLLPPWGNTIDLERIVPFDRGDGFTLDRTRVEVARSGYMWRLCTAPRLGAPVWSLEPCGSLPDGAGDAARERLERAEEMKRHETRHGDSMHAHPHGGSSHGHRHGGSSFMLLFALLLTLPVVGGAAIVRVLTGREVA